LTLGPNAEATRQAFERWNAGDRTPPVDQMDPEIEIHTPIGVAFKGEPFRGHEGAREWLANLDENFDQWELRPEEFREEGDTVLVLGSIHTRGRGSGVVLDQEVGWVLRFRAGRVVRLQTYLDRDEALAASGLS
jgi:ketosteroid isomerase-like protein